MNRKKSETSRCLDVLIRQIIIGAFMVTNATSCAHHSGSLVNTRKGEHTSDTLKVISAYDVISWAHLDDALNNHLDQVKFGEADGKAILSDYVVVLNGKEMVDFVRKHGYRSFRGPIAARIRAASLEVDVEITGKDGSKTVLTLFADGTMQGVG